MFELNRANRILLSILLLLCICCNTCGCNKKIQGAVATRDCDKYVQSSLQAVLYGDYYDYIKNGGDGPEAVNLHEQMIKYFTDMIFYKFGIATDCLNEVIVSEFSVVAENMLKKSSFEVLDTKYVNGNYTVDIAVQPLIFWQLVYAFCGADYNEYMALIDSGEIAMYSENSWHIYMQEYSEKILKGIHTVQERVTGQAQQQHMTITVEVASNGKLSINASEFFAVCDYILALK